MDNLNKYNEVLEKYQDKFVPNVANGLSNVLWQTIVNEVGSDVMRCFIPVLSKVKLEGHSWAIGICDHNETGYIPTGAYFISNNYGEISDICESLNQEVFTMNAHTQMKVQLSSMRQ